LRAGASKIAPHSVSLLAERNVFSFQFVEGHFFTSLATLQVASQSENPAGPLEGPKSDNSTPIASGHL